MKLTTTQSKNIQILRGLAIIAVVFIHNTPSGLAQVFCRPFLNFSVGLFLFFSGMLSCSNKWNPIKRIKKVVIPYFLWTLIYTVIYNITNYQDIPLALLKNVFIGRAATIMYYIFVYCEFNLLIPLIDKLAKSRFRYWGFIITPIEIIFMRTIPLIAGVEINPYIRIIMSISCIGWFSYFYLGYLLGNNLIYINITQKKIALLWGISIILQICEGFYYYTIGNANCGTQLKLTSIITGILFALMAYNHVMNDRNGNNKLLLLLGDNSFGIYFSHLAIMSVIAQIPNYTSRISYPINAIISVALTLICVLIGKKILGKYSKYLAL